MADEVDYSINQINTHPEPGEMFTPEAKQVLDVNIAVALLKGMHKEKLISDKTMKNILKDAQKRVEKINKTVRIENERRKDNER